MIRTVKPKNARSKRALEKKQPKIVENVKTVLFVPGQTTNQALHDICIDFASLKEPYQKRLHKKNKILPFEDASSLEFFSEKNDTSIIVLSTSNKKRPNNLTFVRMFNYSVYDMIEMQVIGNFKLLRDFKTRAFQVGLKPMFTFQGQVFDTVPVFKQVKSLFLDMFRGEVTSLLDVAGLQWVISVSAVEEDDNNETVSKFPLVHFRVYKLVTYHSPEPKLPRVELVETGPRLDFKIGRYQLASPEVQKEAFKIPPQLRKKTKKNVETDMLGDKVATIHVGKQDLSRLQTRKMKGLKSRYDQHPEEEPVDNIEEEKDSQEKKRQKRE